MLFVPNIVSFVNVMIVEAVVGRRRTDKSDNYLGSVLCVSFHPSLSTCSWQTELSS